MVSNVSTTDGLGFEEVNQATDTDLISGANVYGTTGSFVDLRITTEDVVTLNASTLISGATIKGNTISGNTISVGGEGILHSVSIDNAAAIYGQKIKIGSVLMGDSISGLVVFKAPFSTANYMIFATPQEYNVPQYSRTGSQSSYCVSGTKATGSCFLVGGSATVVGWLAIGN